MEIALLALFGLGAALLFDLFDGDGDSSDNEGGGDPDDDSLLGGDGDDTLSGSGTMTVRGGAGDDLLSGSDQAVVRGGLGADTITVEGDATALGGWGDDHLWSSGGTAATPSHAFLDGGVGDDTLTARGEGPVTLLGGAGDDSLRAESQALAAGGAGDDHLMLDDRSVGYGNTGDDRIVANDYAHAFGGDGDDSIRLNGFTVGNGGAGNDTIAVNNYGGHGVARGSYGDDVISVLGTGEGYGNDGNDDMRAIGENASIYGGNDDDRLVVAGGGNAYGEAGNDYLLSINIYPYGGGDLDGGVGDDTLVVDGTWGGVAVLTGGVGSDSFVLGNTIAPPNPYNTDPEAIATITDFDPDEDMLLIHGAAPGAIDIHPSDSGEATVVDLVYDTGITASYWLEGAPEIALDQIRFVDLPPDGDLYELATDGGLAAHSLAIVQGTAGDDVLDAESDALHLPGAGDDTIVAAAGTGNAVILGGAGDDVIDVHEMIGGSVNGGEGADTISLNGTITLTLGDQVEIAGDHYIVHVQPPGTEGDTLVPVHLDGQVAPDQITLAVPEGVNDRIGLIRDPDDPTSLTIALNFQPAIILTGVDVTDWDLPVYWRGLVSVVRDDPSHLI
ncbi:MAG: hypothetical protein R3D85_11635 [Paracoccaceae bacterium]